MKYLILLVLLLTQACASTKKAPSPDPDAPARTADRDFRRMIKSTVQAHSGDFKKCYVLALDRDKTVEGKIVLAWIISVDGTVKEASLKSSTFKDKGMEDCLLKNLALWKFDLGDRNTEAQISFPFIFNRDTK